MCRRRTRPVTVKIYSICWFARKNAAKFCKILLWSDCPRHRASPSGRSPGTAGPVPAPIALGVVVERLPRQTSAAAGVGAPRRGLLPGNINRVDGREPPGESSTPAQAAGNGNAAAILRCPYEPLGRRWCVRRPRPMSDAHRLSCFPGAARNTRPNKMFNESNTFPTAKLCLVDRASSCSHKARGSGSMQHTCDMRKIIQATQQLTKHQQIRNLLPVAPVRARARTLIGSEHVRGPIIYPYPARVLRAKAGDAGGSPRKTDGRTRRPSAPTLSDLGITKCTADIPSA
jgi:hypothetical protein